jgi:isochorismate hydrolase
MPLGKINEDYITKKNLPSKTRKWLKEINPHISAHRLKSFSFYPKNSALLVIDMQNYFIDDSSHAFLPAAKVIVGNVMKLVSAYRKRNLPVIFTYYALKEGEKPGIMGRWWRDVLRDTDVLARVIPELEPQSGETVVRKSRYSAFVNTRLDYVLNSLNVSQVVITGVMTHLCCETTARDAFQRDYEVFFVVDATATQYEALHVSSLRTLSCGFVVPSTTGEIITCLVKRK